MGYLVHDAVQTWGSLNIMTLGFQSGGGRGGAVMSSLELLIASHQLCGISTRWSTKKQTQLAWVQSCHLCPPYPTTHEPYPLVNYSNKWRLKRWLEVDTEIDG